jgi:hypothetical protein
LGFSDRLLGLQTRELVGDRPWNVQADVLVIPEFWAASLRRDWPQSGARKQLDLLEAGRTEYRLVGRWPSKPFLNRNFYRFLDAGHGAQFWQGFSVYAKGQVARRMLSEAHAAGEAQAEAVETERTH